MSRADARPKLAVMAGYQLRDRVDLPETTLDRAGWALGAGGLLGGAVWLVLALGSGTATLLALVTAFILGTVFTMLGAASVGVPIWLVLHVKGWRSMRVAALTGAAIGFVLFLFAQTYGFGLFDAPPSDGTTLLYRWASAVGTSLLMAGVAAAIATVMWAIAYRPRG